ncbi:MULTISPECIES: SDR family oxidoreductase [Gammaproteobacteria]|uniref:SDR family oxidoreductase n=1 Tax=Gammaproteobacteria TaxID=1236 RepID=UPI000DCFB243|nr:MULTISPECIES: SDR family oxidoreductase [Gammaproteobacteria]RTE87500.1 SDR family oxidoreductase [Aliidiomarina sp. B3213]TCZ92715.1 SDR family oxidoreductase [Lysobacter sp. N42]
MSHIQGKTIWLTGASSGIGLALAEALAARGAKLILTARSEDKLKALAEKLPGAHEVVPMDLMKPEAAFQQAQALANEKEIDILINNAGVSQRSLALETDLKVFRDLMEINYFSVVALTQAVLPTMVARRSGHIVTVSSVAGKVGTKLRSGYAGSKFGIIGYMDCIRAEMKENNIPCTTICPGFVHTQIAHNALTGTGEKLNKADPDNAGGISAEQCAKEIVQAIEKDKAEVVVGSGLSKLAPRLQRLFPGLVRKLVANR